jgi:hypothetical protein
MKVQPSLFSTSAIPARPVTQNSAARLAFEAMLSAGAARQSVPARTEVAKPSPPAEPAEAPFARPGRVLDIRV